MTNHNLFIALRQAFPSNLQDTAVEATSTSGQTLHYSWHDIDARSAQIANLLQGLGLPEGSRIAVQVEKSVEAMLLYLATLRSGFIFLPLNTAYQNAEIEYFVQNAEPAVFICTPANLARIAPIAQQAGTHHVLTLGDDQSGTLLEQAASCATTQTPVRKQPDDVAAILYTSGTTGRSKGAMLTHGNLQSNALMLKDYWGWKEGDVLIHALPIFHVHGLFVAIHAALINGSKMIWLSKFDPKAVIAAMPRATVFMGVPTLYVRMLAEPTLTREQAQHMRLFLAGSAPLLIETFHEWQARTGHIILERYGMSETIMLTSNPYNADARYGGQSTRKGGTVGFPLPGVQLRVVNDQGALASAGEIGNLQVQGPNVFKGYWRMPEKTKEEFTADGWFKTGDVGKMEATGYVTIVGRSKDLIISGGYNVYPAEIESYINELPGVAESALIGVPHPDFGEVGVAVIIPKPGAVLDSEHILAAIKGQLANFKVPKRCLIEQELPRNAMGKVQKNVLREGFKDMFATAKL